MDSKDVFNHQKKVFYRELDGLFRNLGLLISCPRSPVLCYIINYYFNVISFRFGTCSDVQRWVSARKPSLGGRFQTAAESWLWYFCESDKETEANPEEDGDWHGGCISPWDYCFKIKNIWEIFVFSKKLFSCGSYISVLLLFWSLCSQRAEDYLRKHFLLMGASLFI